MNTYYNNCSNFNKFGVKFYKTTSIKIEKGVFSYNFVQKFHFVQNYNVILPIFIDQYFSPNGHYDRLQKKLLSGQQWEFTASKIENET